MSPPQKISTTSFPKRLRFRAFYAFLNRSKSVTVNKVTTETAVYFNDLPVASAFLPRTGAAVLVVLSV